VAMVPARERLVQRPYLDAVPDSTDPAKKRAVSGRDDPLEPRETLGAPQDSSLRYPWRWIRIRSRPLADGGGEAEAGRLLGEYWAG
jgi:hypothetical protein